MEKIVPVANSITVRNFDLSTGKERRNNLEVLHNNVFSTYFGDVSLIKGNFGHKWEEKGDSCHSFFAEPVTLTVDGVVRQYMQSGWGSFIKRKEMFLLDTSHLQLEKRLFNLLGKVESLSRVKHLCPDSTSGLAGDWNIITAPPGSAVVWLDGSTENELSDGAGVIRGGILDNLENLQVQSGGSIDYIRYHRFNLSEASYVNPTQLEVVDLTSELFKEIKPTVDKSLRNLFHASKMRSDTMFRKDVKRRLDKGEELKIEELGYIYSDVDYLTKYCFSILGDEEIPIGLREDIVRHPAFAPRLNGSYKKLAETVASGGGLLSSMGKSMPLHCRSRHKREGGKGGAFLPPCDSRRVYAVTAGQPIDKILAFRYPNSDRLSVQPGDAWSSSPGNGEPLSEYLSQAEELQYRFGDKNLSINAKGMSFRTPDRTWRSGFYIVTPDVGDKPGRAFYFGPEQARHVDLMVSHVDFKMYLESYDFDKNSTGLNHLKVEDGIYMITEWYKPGTSFAMSDGFFLEENESYSPLQTPDSESNLFVEVSPRDAPCRIYYDEVYNAKSRLSMDDDGDTFYLLNGSKETASFVPSYPVLYDSYESLVNTVDTGVSKIEKSVTKFPESIFSATTPYDFLEPISRFSYKLAVASSKNAMGIATNRRRLFYALSSITRDLVCKSRFGKSAVDVIHRTSETEEERLRGLKFGSNMFSMDDVLQRAVDVIKTFVNMLRALGWTAEVVARLKSSGYTDGIGIIKAGYIGMSRDNRWFSQVNPKYTDLCSPGLDGFVPKLLEYTLECDENGDFVRIPEAIGISTLPLEHFLRYCPQLIPRPCLALSRRISTIFAEKLLEVSSTSPTEDDSDERQRSRSSLEKAVIEMNSVISSLISERNYRKPKDSTDISRYDVARAMLFDISKNGREGRTTGAQVFMLFGEEVRQLFREIVEADGRAVHRDRVSDIKSSCDAVTSNVLLSVKHVWEGSGYPSNLSLALSGKTIVCDVEETISRNLSTGQPTVKFAVVPVGRRNLPGMRDIPKVELPLGCVGTLKDSVQPGRFKVMFDFSTSRNGKGGTMHMLLRRI
ncbi:MAG: hypothetical protein GY861_21255 [bacterium]|nr:hypothetical protein [bacterium]